MKKRGLLNDANNPRGSDTRGERKSTKNVPYTQEHDMKVKIFFLRSASPYVIIPLDKMSQAVLITCQLLCPGSLPELHGKGKHV